MVEAQPTILARAVIAVPGSMDGRRAKLARFLAAIDGAWPVFKSNPSVKAARLF